MDRKSTDIKAMDGLDVSKQALQHIENYTKEDWDRIRSIMADEWQNIDFPKIVQEGGVAIYCRVAAPADHGIARQKEQLLKFTNDVGIDSALIRFYEDDGYNGLTLDRPGLQALLKDIRNNIVKTVFAVDESRISRELEDLYIFYDEINLYDVSVISPKHGRLHSAYIDLSYLVLTDNEEDESNV